MCGSVVKNPPASAGEEGLIPGLGRSPGGGNCNPLQYSSLEIPMDRETPWATFHRVTRSQMWLNTRTHYLQVFFFKNKLFLVREIYVFFFPLSSNFCVHVLWIGSKQEKVSRDWSFVEKFMITLVLISYKKIKKDNQLVASLSRSKERSAFLSLLVGRWEMRQKTLI